jgi:hypothetical protein
MMKIDAVITWVDGNDPEHRRKRAEYGSDSLFKIKDIASSTRYASVGEIFWCVASLNRFAPWIHKIYIVTDNQDPGLDGFMKSRFPDSCIPMEIVDHKVIFRGYEDYLPTFNSISLETMTWRIPGLSDHFIEFNDDLMLTAPVQPQDFFTQDGKVICYARKSSMHLTRLTRLFKPVKFGIKPVTTKGSHMNGARLAGSRFWFLRLAHCQKALRRDFYQEYFSEHPEELVRNISHRFRSAEQFTPQELQYITLYDRRECELRSPRKDFFYFIPKSKRGYFEGKMKKLEHFSGKFACFNNVDLATPEQLKTLIRWIEQRLGVSFD